MLKTLARLWAAKPEPAPPPIETILVEVTQEDYEEAVRGSEWENPVCRAICRALGQDPDRNDPFDHLSGRHLVWITDGSDAVGYFPDDGRFYRPGGTGLLPIEVCRMLRRFHDGQPVEPVSFRVRGPDPFPADWLSTRSDRWT